MIHGRGNAVMSLQSLLRNEILNHWRSSILILLNEVMMNWATGFDQFRNIWVFFQVWAKWNLKFQTPKIVILSTGICWSDCAVNRKAVTLNPIRIAGSKRWTFLSPVLAFDSYCVKSNAWEAVFLPSLSWSNNYLVFKSRSAEARYFVLRARHYVSRIQTLWWSIYELTIAAYKSLLC